MTQTTVLILDFDGTIALADVGDELCDRFAPPEWAEIDAMFQRRELSLPDAQKQMWALMRCTEAALDAETDRVGTLRHGLDGLLDRADADGVRLVLASGGFDRYIRRILGPRHERFEQAFYSDLTVQGDRLSVTFPLADRLGCPQAAVCKGAVCDLYREQGCRVIFVGDGASDRCAIGRADVLYAVRDSKLAAWADEAGVATVPFDSFDEVTW
ncbi:MAG: 2-hydroxy-3-keto-5-methylthiopentenyl-1-phosphate phosphatase [Myxococcota bacterium]|jgi:2-hydroxy-3-keto-5-methylthiopentenyl-1-phosphate phosphatase